MKKFSNTFILAVYSGLMIGFGGIVYLSMENKIAGAFLFSFGLLTIVTQKFNLYTGKIGFVSNKEEATAIPIIILGNLVGTWIMAILAQGAGVNCSSVELWEKKMSNSLIHTFILAMFCGVMMYLAIDNYNKSKHLLFVIMPIMIFILSGFEHSVADMFYCFFANAYTLKSCVYLIVMILGNGVGSLMFHHMRQIGQ